MHARISESLATDVMLPAVGQGIVGIECRSDRDALAALLQQLQSEPAEQAIAAERAVAQKLEANCHSPLGVHATIDDDGQLTVNALLTSIDGQCGMRESACGPATSARFLGEEVAARMLDDGAAELIAQAL